MAVKLDLKDWKLLKELDINARQSLSEISKKLLLNKNTINYRINRLEKEKIILGYSAVVNNLALGYISFRVYLDFLNTTFEDEEKIIDYLKSTNIIVVVGSFDRGHDLVLISWTKTPFEFESFWMQFKSKFKKNIWKEEVHFFSEVYYFKRNYLTLEQSEKYESLKITPLSQIDDFDIQILKNLVENAKIPLIELAEKLNSPPRTVAFRIKKLEQKKIITGYRVNIDLSKIGYEYHKINIVLDESEDPAVLFNFAKYHPNIIYLDKSISKFDLELDVEVKNNFDLKKLIQEIKEKFKVREIEILTLSKFHKIKTLPDF